jgi:hypothetical protein
MTRGFALVVVALLVGWLLSGGVRAQAAKPTVKIIFPHEGAVLPAGDLTVTMVNTGARLVPADEMHDARTGHFHLYLDKVPEHVGRPIPKGVDGIVHTADRSFTLKGVTRGLHTLVLIWAYGDHIPFSPWVSDTVMFEVR